jgi:hypothetical protein
MNEQSYKVELVPATEVETVLRQHGNRRSLVLSGGFELVGEFSLTARNSESGEVEWEHADKNLITDYGRRWWMYAHWSNAAICFAPSLEVPQLGRYSISTDATQCVASWITAVNTPATHTKTFSTTFGTPAANRTLGTILLCDSSPVTANKGVVTVCAFALLTPPKTQTTVQTLEVVYRVSMNPIA